jgi:hypothetical protein
MRPASINVWTKITSLEMTGRYTVRAEVWQKFT